VGTGATAGTVVAAGAVTATGAAVAVVVGLVAVVLGTTLRAIGRGFGRGTVGLAAQASTANAEKPTANVRLVAKAVVAKAVDRNAAARTRRFTAFLHGESFDRSVSGLVD
jgi:hypothetical protein